MGSVTDINAGGMSVLHGQASDAGTRLGLAAYLFGVAGGAAQVAWSLGGVAGGRGFRLADRHDGLQKREGREGRMASGGQRFRRN